MNSFIGLTLGSYTIQGYLPEGGMADLYLGIHVRLGTSAAIKILKVQFAQNDKHRQEFKDEAVRLAQLDHHLIIRILDCGFLGDRPYLIMPLAKGSLKEFQGTILPLDRIVTYANQIAEALEYAHNRDIVHRDIKPENLLIGSRGEIILSDFGIATITHSVRVSQQEVIGSPQYMAPEQWQGKARRVSDQYALGIVVYQWLCGELPFQGSMEQLMWAHLQQSPPSFKEKGVQVPSEVEEVVMTALAKDPKRRYRSVQNFVNALQACLPQPGRPLFTKPFSQFKVCSIAWSPDGLRIASLSRDGKGSVWQVANRRQIFAWVNDKLDEDRFFTTGQNVAWAPNGQHIAAVAGSHIDIYDADTGEKVTTFSDLAGAMAWSPDSKYIASMSPGDVLQVWDATTGDIVSTFNCTTRNSRLLGVYSVAWSPNGTHIASANGADRVWVSNARTGDHTYYYRGLFQATVAWSPDGTRIASSSFNLGVEVWEADTRTHIYTYRGHSTGRDTVHAMAWSPDGKYIASEGAKNTVQIWEAATGNQKVTYLGHSELVNAVAWSPDGTRIASASKDNTVQLWRAL